MKAIHATSAPPRVRTAPLVDQVMVVRLDERGVWAAIRELRRRMRELEGRPRVVFLVATNAGGRIVRATDPAATKLVLGYRPRGRAR